VCRLVRVVWQRAGEHCEYCLIPQFAFPLPFQIDHIIAEKHRGQTVETNLALALRSLQPLQGFKGPNIAGGDPASGQLVRLFHPRNDAWVEHFRMEGPRIMGRTPVGRATIEVLRMNADDLLLIRVELLAEGGR
jgi:hypothetical protein